MAVPHKGVPLALRRTYNSQSEHDMAGSDGTPPSMYGNGWTSSFDAHLSGSSTGTIRVWDADGARYDYTLAADGHTRIAPPGQYATLVSDGGCGFLWTQKSGVTYYFWTPDGLGSCVSSWNASYGAYAGRLYQIIGRNRNTSITFYYSWDGGNSAAGGKIWQVQAQTESGMTATLSFADVSGHRLLQQILYPDNVTTVTYGYDAAGDLTSVSEPAYDAAGDRAVHGFGYQALGAGMIMYYVTSPRWTGTDGGYTLFGFAGASPASSTVSTIGRVGIVNPAVPDGTGAGFLQAGNATGVVQYLSEWYGTGGVNPWFHDSDGHSTNWVVDSVGRPTQTQECTAMSGWTCTGTWLVSNEAWDSVNNLATEIDPRGNRADYLYDPAGNTIAVGAPLNATSQGTFRPTKIFDYDTNNNLVAYCDETEAHAAGADWVGPYPTVMANDSLCRTYGGATHWTETFVYPSYEPYGELASMTTPLGYTRTYSYAAGQQAGNDYGLPTSIVGATFTQADGTSVTPAQTFWYDAAGNIRCSSDGQGTSVMSYDALGRATSVADPDDSSANGSSLCGKSTGQPGWNTQSTSTYFPNGAPQSSQTPAERAAGVATTFTYDADGNPTTETSHLGCASGSACTAGITTKWYDGADRLIEVGLPHAPSDYYASPWPTRYFYDLSGGGSVSFGGTAFRAYGNLFKTQEWVPATGASSPAWQDLRGSGFDGLSRAVAKYGFSPSSNSTVRTTTMVFDATTATSGLLSSMTDPLSETTTYGYDAAGKTVSVQFTGDGGITPNKSFAYDAAGRQTNEYGAVFGTKTIRYDADGRAVEVDEPTTGSVTSPARLTYDYYPNGQKKDVNVASNALNASPLMSYDYRADGQRTKVHIGFGQQQGDFLWTFTDGGRALSQSDPYTGTQMPNTQAPVGAGMTYPTTARSYDAFGQITSLRLPETFAYTFSHDYEGEIAGWTAPYKTGTATMALTNNLRGENVQEFLSSGSAYTTSRSSFANGDSVRLRPFVKFGGQQTNTLDPTNAVVSATSREVFAVSPDMGRIDCGPLTTSNDYDFASRKVSTSDSESNWSSDPSCSDIRDPGPNATPLYSYDAENHTTVIQTTGAIINWDPAGHPYKIGSSLHNDRSGILFTTDAAGTLTQVKIETLADIDSSGHMVVLDRDGSGQRMSEHDNVSYGSIGLGSSVNPTIYNPTIPFVFPGSTNADQCTSGNCTRAANLEYNHSDGFTYAGLTFQGTRAADTSSGQWTTPDAVTGAADDPMSQKAFALDRNNAHEYVDPTGFTPNQFAQCECSGGYGYQTLAAAKAQAKSQRNPLPQDLKYRDEIFKAAQAHNIDPFLLAAIAAQESGGPDVNSGNAGKAGGGLFQIDPVTWKDLLAAHNGGKTAADNAEVAAIIMADNLSVSHGDVDGALRRWNSGDLNGVTTVTRGWMDGIHRYYPESVHLHEHMLQKMLGGT